MSMAFLGAMNMMAEQVLEEALRAMHEPDNLETDEVDETEAEQDSTQLASANGASEQSKNPRS